MKKLALLNKKKEKCNPLLLQSYYENNILKPLIAVLLIAFCFIANERTKDKTISKKLNGRSEWLCQS
jgi:glycerol-3-phosphate O-acyltransferase